MPVEENYCQISPGERLFYRLKIGSPAKAPLLIIHGHGEHSGRYLKFFERLKDLDISIAVFDLRGCGLSSGKRVYVSQFEQYLSDLNSFIRFLKESRRLSGPFCLLGNSMGGLIATAWARDNAHEVEKLILSSPLFGLPREGLLKIPVEISNALIPGLVIKNPVYPPYLSHDAGEVEKYRKDPLIQRKITIRLTHEMLRYMALFRRGHHSFSFPVYILMAAEDFVVNPDATRDFFLRIRAPEKDLETFQGFYHEIFNEVEQDKAFERLRHYLGRPSAGAAR